MCITELYSNIDVQIIGAMNNIFRESNQVKMLHMKIYLCIFKNILQFGRSAESSFFKTN